MHKLTLYLVGPIVKRPPLVACNPGRANYGIGSRKHLTPWVWIKKAARRILVVIPGGAVILVTSVDFNRYKGLIAEQVKKATGRKLLIGGDFGLALSPTPTVTIDNVFPANFVEPHRGGRRPMRATARSFPLKLWER